MLYVVLRISPLSVLVGNSWLTGLLLNRVHPLTGFDIANMAA